MSVYKKLLSYLTSPQKCVSYIKYRGLHSSYGRKLDDVEYVKRMFKFMQKRIEMNVKCVFQGFCVMKKCIFMRLCINNLRPN